MCWKASEKKMEMFRGHFFHKKKDVVMEAGQHRFLFSVLDKE